MAELHPGITGRKPTAPASSDDEKPVAVSEKPKAKKPKAKKPKVTPAPVPVAALPPFVSVTQTAATLCISRATVWRRIKDRTLVRVGTGKITKQSIERYSPAPHPPSLPLRWRCGCSATASVCCG
jgi:hypothetical protein